MKPAPTIADTDLAVDGFTVARQAPTTEGNFRITVALTCAIFAPRITPRARRVAGAGLAAISAGTLLEVRSVRRIAETPKVWLGAQLAATINAVSASRTWEAHLLVRNFAGFELAAFEAVETLIAL